MENFTIIIILAGIFLGLSKTEKIFNNEISPLLPNIWGDEVVSRMIRDVIFRDLMKENKRKQEKRQHKREVYSTVSPVLTSRAQTTRIATLTSKKDTKPTKVTQTAGNKTKNRIADTATSTFTTESPVKLSMNHVPPNSNLSSKNLTSSSNSSKIKVRFR